MRDDSDDTPCISFLAREVQPEAKLVKAYMEEESGVQVFGPVRTGATGGGETHPWSFTPRAERAVSFGGSVAEAKSNLYYTFGMANDEEPVNKVFMASSSVDVTSDDSVNGNPVTLSVARRASGH